MAKTKIPDSEQVTQLIEKMDAESGAVIQFLREIILSADKEVAEQVKWNSPAFYYTGEMKPFDPKEYKRDIVVINLHRGKQILLVFPTGATIKDTTGILEGTYTDGRRMVNIKDMADAKSKGKSVKKVVKDWLKLVEKP